MKYNTKGKELVEWMRAFEKVQDDPTTSSDNQAAAGVYAGFVMGVVDTTEVLNIPITTTGDIFAIVTRYLNDHPQEWNEPASKLVIKALTEAYAPQKMGALGRFFYNVQNPGGLRTASTNRSGRRKG